MDKRPFYVRASCVAAGVALIALGSLVVPASAVACLVLFDESASGNRYVEDDAVLGAVVFALAVALGYGVFVAPWLWKNRPFQPARSDSKQHHDMERERQIMETWRFARQYDERHDRVPGHLWQTAPVVQSAVPLQPRPIVHVAEPPKVEAGAKADINPKRSEREAAVRSDDKYADVGVPTLVGIPVMAAVEPDDVCKDEDWFS